MSAPYPDRYPEDRELLEVVTTYLGDTSWSPEVLTDVLLAEQAAQSRRHRVPAEGEPWPADLAEALCRRVARNLAMRALPLGFQASMTEAAVAVTKVGTDVEIARLEAPFRKLGALG